ncbi:MAG TPA: hypothetical protein VLG27_01375 [Candidatus Saccharimonadia bacterium]|nr:hypothetical protein [Candidatus Saccharimonadia bacterium]
MAYEGHNPRHGGENFFREMAVERSAEGSGLVRLCSALYQIVKESPNSDIWLYKPQGARTDEEAFRHRTRLALFFPGEVRRNMYLLKHKTPAEYGEYITENFPELAEPVNGIELERLVAIRRKNSLAFALSTNQKQKRQLNRQRGNICFSYSKVGRFPAHSLELKPNFEPLVWLAVINQARESTVKEMKRKIGQHLTVDKVTLGVDLPGQRNGVAGANVEHEA